MLGQRKRPKGAGEPTPLQSEFTVVKKDARRLLTKFLARMIITGVPAHRRASSGDSPVGRSRERLPAALACTQPRGRCRPRAEATNAIDLGLARDRHYGAQVGQARPAVERREARRPDRKGRKDASQASSACFASTQRVPRSTPRLPALRSPFAPISSLPEIGNHVRRSGKPDLRAAGEPQGTLRRGRRRITNGRRRHARFNNT